jgi:hypothetical protein
MHDVKFLPKAQRNEIRQLEIDMTALLQNLLCEINPALMADERMRKPYSLLLFGMMIWTFSWYRPGGSIEPAELAKRVSSLILDGFRAPRPPLDIEPPDATRARSSTLGGVQERSEEPPTAINGLSGIGQFRGELLKSVDHIRIDLQLGARAAGDRATDKLFRIACNGLALTHFATTSAAAHKTHPHLRRAARPDYQSHSPRCRGSRVPSPGSSDAGESDPARSAFPIAGARRGEVRPRRQAPIGDWNRPSPSAAG